MVRFFAAGLFIGLPLGCYLREKGYHRRLQDAYRVLRPGNESKWPNSISCLSIDLFVQLLKWTIIATLQWSSTRTCKVEKQIRKILNAIFTASTAPNPTTEMTRTRITRSSTESRSRQRMNSRAMSHLPSLNSESGAKLKVIGIKFLQGFI